jgi:hypothetical protein
MLSRLGIIERFARQVEVAGTGRWTTAASHDADYNGTVEVLRLAEASWAVSRTSLLTRDGLVYDNRRGPDGQWTIRVSSVDVLREARDTPLGRLQRMALANRLADTIAPMDLGESATYLAHHLALVGRTEPLFADDAIAPLHRVAGGLPRKLNNAATAALIAAADGEALVDDTCAKRAAAELTRD